MANAKELMAQLRRELVGVEQRLFNHRWITAAEAGQLRREDLVLFAGQQYRIIRSDLRSVALLVHRFPDPPSGPFLQASLRTETAALEAVLAFGSALGADRSRLAASPLLAGAQAYTHFLAWLAAYGSDAEMAAGLFVNLPAWGKNCGRLAAAMRLRYGLREPDLKFFALFAEEAPGLEEACLAVIQAGLNRGVTPVAVRQAAQLLQEYELMFWDALAGATEQPH